MASLNTRFLEDSVERKRAWRLLLTRSDECVEQEIMIAFVFAVVFLVLVLVLVARRKEPPLEKCELGRMKSQADKLHREEAFTFE